MTKLRIIDVETGEDYSQDYTLRHKRQDDAFKRKLEERTNNGRQRDFTASNMRNLHEVYSVLTTAQCGYLMLLQCYVGYDDGILVNSAKQPMTTSDMMSVLQLGRKRQTFYDFLNACIRNDIIRKTDEGQYAVNPYYHFRGAFGSNSQYVVKSYTSKVKRVYREVKAADIGLIYRMLPFIHYETNALCDNPYEKDPTKIRWFNRKELAEVIGVNAATLGRRLPNMKFDDEYVVARIKVGKEPERYTFNPRVFYRKDSEPDSTLIALFNTDKRK